MTGTGRYVYAVVATEPGDAIAGVAGLGGAPVEVVEHRGLRALVSEVELAEYGEDGLRRNLEDLGWLEATARAHDMVVRNAAGSGPVAPLRLATIFFDDDGVRRCLDERHDDFRAALARVEGRAEWSVKVLSTPRPAAEAARSAPSSGADYLRRKKAQSRARETTEAAALEAAERIAVAASETAVAVRRLQPQDPRLSGLEGTMLLNIAVLADRESTEGFGRRLEELADAEPAVTAVVAGPWPAYSFATLEP